MKKAMLLCGLCLVAVLGLAPYWFGQQAEPIFQNFIRQAQVATQLPIRITHYDRGWFQSTAETMVQLPPEAMEAVRWVAPQAPSTTAQPLVLTMTHQLFHGPFPLAIFWHGQGSLAPVQMHIETTMPMAAKGAFSPGQIVTVIGLSGAGSSAITLPAGQVLSEAHEPTTLSWQPLHGQLAFTANGQHLTGTLSTAAVTGKGPQGDLKAQVIRLQAEAEADEQRYQCRLTVQGERLEFAHQEPGPQAVILHDWSLQHTAVIAPENSDITAIAQVQTIQTPGSRYGPGTGTLVIRRLHTMSLLTLGRTLLPYVATADHASLLPLGGLIKTLPLFIKRSPEVELTQVSLHTSAGEVRGKAKVILEPGKSPGLMTLLRPLHAIQGQGEAAAPVALLQQQLTPAFLEQLHVLEQRGYVVREGDNYVLSARFRQGQLLVNNKPMALSLFGG